MHIEEGNFLNFFPLLDLINYEKPKRREESFSVECLGMKLFRIFLGELIVNQTLLERKDTDSFHIPHKCDFHPLSRRFYIGEWLDWRRSKPLCRNVNRGIIHCQLFLLSLSLMKYSSLNVHSLLRVKNNISLRQSRPYESAFCCLLCSSSHLREFIYCLNDCLFSTKWEFFSASLYAFLIKRIKRMFCAKVYSECQRWDRRELQAKLWHESHLLRWIFNYSTSAQSRPLTVIPLCDF